LISLGLTVLTASISYQCFERPFLRLKQRFTFVTSDKLVEVQ
jgi:peptidoglycan/LPS O-acetylase OafA/YrhL